MQLPGGQHEHELVARGNFEPGKSQFRIGLFQYPPVVSDFHDQDARRFQMFCSLAQNAVDDQEAVAAGGQCEAGLVAILGGQFDVFAGLHLQ